MFTIKQVLIPVEDLDTSIEYYTTRFKFDLKFRDGHRYAALDGGSITLALVTEGENVTNGRVSISVNVSDLDGMVSAAKGRGDQILRDITEGPHERRAVLADNSGNPVVIYSKR